PTCIQLSTYCLETILYEELSVISVILADDHPALRVGLRVLLDREPDITVVGEADDGDAALALLETLRPDVAVLDCQLPGRDGVAVAAAARAQGVPVRVVALSAYDDDRYLAGMAAVGAMGYLLKNEAPGRIVEAARAAMRGESLWTAEQLARVRRWEAEVAALRESLTEREREVLRLVMAGLSNKEIAQVLTISVRTTDFHVSNVLRKLNLISRVEAAVWAKEHLEPR
ncbi:MAG TPA: response regulator transcription factor, partial [Anaerolineae bacterium]|nr:response regulator transcription factor [Anaerolineae bacterium]HQM14273.1 response regulator transcription factor [Anaerolineae bacterium]